MTISTIIADIEGTTSAISFVTETLFPYAADKLPEFVRSIQQQPEVAQQLNVIRTEINNTNASIEEVINTLLQWIEEDRKATPLKTLQGMIWEDGYADGSLKGHIYADAYESQEKLLAVFKR